MKKSRQMRVEQRIKIIKLGRIFVNLAVLLGFLGFVFATLNGTGPGLIFVGLAAVMAPIGAVVVIFVKND
ncbi:MAG: hypothetical protein IPJ90_15230 [Anaerolineaceae bacterium]|nr:hypothetical protein [Anaerolineaceae bacterium]